MTPPDELLPDPPVVRPALPVARSVPRRAAAAKPPKKNRTALYVLGTLGVFGVLFIGACVWIGLLFKPPAAIPEADRTAMLVAGRPRLVAAFEKPADPAAAAEFRPFFDTFAGAADGKKRGSVLAIVDFDRMAVAADEFGLTGELNIGGSLGRAAAAAVLRKNCDPSGADWWPAGAAEMTVHAAEFAADRNSAIVFTVHRFTGQETPDYRCAWWLVRGPGGWKMYDCEHLNDGYRLTADIASSTHGLNSPNGSRLETAFETLRAISAAWEKDDTDTVRACLATLEGVPLPPLGESRKQEYIGLLAESADDAAGAEAAYTRGLDAYPPNAALHRRRGELRRTSGNPAGAAEDATAFRRLYGPDAISDLLDANLATEAGRKDDAAKLFARAADARPDLTAPLVGLVNTGDAAGAAKRAAAAKDPALALRTCLRDVRRTNHAAAVAVAEAFETARPADPVGPAELAAALVRSGRYVDAAKAVRRAVDRHHEAAEAAEEYFDPKSAYLSAMIDADRTADAYAAFPRSEAHEAFGTLADQLYDRLTDRDDPDPNADPNATGPDVRLAELIALHRKAVPADPFADYYSGQLAVTARDTAAALPLFAAALKAAGNTDDAVTIRSAWAGAMFDLGRGQEAYDTGPRLGPGGAEDRRRLFQQLAYRFHTPLNVAGLDALTKAHRAADATDPRGRWWAGQVFFAKGEYGPALKEYRAARDGKADEHEYADWLGAEQIVRCLVRLGRGKECPKEVPATGGETWIAGTTAILAAAAAGDVPGTLEALETATKHGRKADGFYADADLGPILRSPAFAPVREKYPPPAAAPAADPNRAK